MSLNYPWHVHQLIETLETSHDIIATLLESVYTLNFDTTLYHIYLNLGYCPETGSFSATPSKSRVLELICKEYSHNEPIPQDLLVR